MPSNISKNEKQRLAILVGIQSHQIRYYPPVFFGKLQEIEKKEIILDRDLINKIFIAAATENLGLTSFCSRYDHNEILQKMFNLSEKQRNTNIALEVHVEVAKREFDTDLLAIYGVEEWAEIHESDFEIVYNNTILESVAAIQGKSYAKFYADYNNDAAASKHQLITEDLQIDPQNEQFFPLELLEVLQNFDGLSAQERQIVHDLPWVVTKMCLEQNRAPKAIFESYHCFSEFQDTVHNAITGGRKHGEHTIDLSDGNVHDFDHENTVQTDELKITPDEIEPEVRANNILDNPERIATQDDREAAVALETQE